MSTLALDDETKARLRWEAERLAAEQSISLQRAREIVWLDYLDECGQPQPPQAEAVAEAPAAPPVATPVPEPPGTYGKPIAAPSLPRSGWLPTANSWPK